MLLALVVALPAAQIPQGPVTEVFPPEEFAARRAAVFEAIGDSVAVLQGAVEPSAELPFRQNNQVFYLTGIEVPRAIVVLDGRARTATAYIPKDGFRIRALGTSLVPGDEAARLTGLDAVRPREDFAAVVPPLGRDSRIVYTPAGGGVVGGGSRAEVNGLAAATEADPWDGRPSREAAFRDRLRAAAGRTDLEIRDLDPILDRQRLVKSPREIAVIREATRITGLGIMEAMREAAPGRYEYELQAVAEYAFKHFGSQGPAYFALSAAGPNMAYSHYHKGTRRLAAGELVQFDYAPDYRYYVSDVTRVFPADGRFTPKQREFYTVYLGMYRALMEAVRPGVPVTDLLHEAGARMDQVIAGMRFESPAIKAAATAFAARYKNSRSSSFGHGIGMEVHDVGLPRPRDGEVRVLLPGQVFTIEPALQVPDEGLAMRLEDALLVTATGYENLSAFVPLEIAAIERLMAEPGITALVDGRNSAERR